MRAATPWPIRSLLFAPGNRPELMEQAWTTGADALIFDLEDSVPDDAKDEARKTVRSMLEKRKTRESRPLVIVRINSTTARRRKADVRAVVCKGLFGVLIPKCESLADIQEPQRLIERQERAAGMRVGSVRLLLLIETAKGLLVAARLAASSARIIGLVLGAEDYRLDMGVAATPERRELSFARSYLPIVARAAECLAIDCAFGDFRNLKGLRVETQTAKELGFNAKLAISSRQIRILHEAFRPSTREVARARRTVDAFAKARAAHSGIAMLDGRMIDKPICDLALRVINLAETDPR